MRFSLQRTARISWEILEPLLGFAVVSFMATMAFGSLGIFPGAFATGAGWKIAAYIVLMTHLTITAMSISFHRAHTHQGVVLNKSVDRLMQTWLVLTTGMSKRDWVSIHIYHHAHSDQELDPHSPKQKGFARIFFLGVYDYVVAKDLPDVVKLRKKIPEDRYEAFLKNNPVIGPIITTMILTVAFGPMLGGILSVLTFLISPIFAVGGVNTIAHAFGYRNYETSDESRNIGYLFPLNWMICGELDHNNHHAHPRSCSFRHRWYEIDIGYVYIRILSGLGLAKIKTAYSLKQSAKEKITDLLAGHSLHSDPKVESPPAQPGSLYA